MNYSSEQTLPLDRRMSIFLLATSRLKDSAFNVRTNAIKLVTRMIETSPYIAFRQDNAKMSEILFQQRLAQIEETFRVLLLLFN